ncbi:hypothetical protein BGX34_007660 [Mortierella sp. NVP85]|nr:hypothetical protein BGX34_007660 [Mortierella sp. NVP85]
MSDRQRGQGSTSAGANGAAVSEQTPLLSGSGGANTPSAAARNNAGTDVERGAGTRAQPQQPPVVSERMRRWKKVYARVVMVIVILLLLCLLGVVIATWAAQRILDKALVLEIQKTEIRDMDETGFQTTINSTIYLDPTHDGFFGLTGYFQKYFQLTLAVEPTTLTLGLPSTDEDVYMAEVQVEKQQMRVGQVSRLDISTHARVTNSVLMAEFFGQTLEQSTVDLAIRGPLVVKLAPIWYMNLWLSKSVPVEGLKGIQDAELVSMELPDNHPLGGISMSGVARINNPSKVMSLYMGPTTFGIYIPSKGHPDVDYYKIAEAVSPSVRLEAGKANDAILSGRLFHLDDWTSSGNGRDIGHHRGSEKQLLLGQLLSKFIQGDNSTIQVRALTKDPNLPSWLREAYKTIVLEMVFPGSPNKDFIQSLMMNELGIGFSDNEGSALLDGRMSSVLQLPPNVTFPIKVLSMRPDAWLKLPGGANMASLVLPDFQPTKSRQAGSTLEVDLALDNTPLEVLQERRQDFYKFLDSSFNKEWVELGIAGGASAIVETGLGTFELGPIPFDVVTRQRGLAGLVAVPPLLQGMDVVESTKHTLTIKATLVIWNPSTITAALGEVSFLWAFNGHLIGVAAVPNGNILPGNNTIECIGVLDPSIDCSRKKDPECDPELAQSATRQFISKYISGDNTTAIEVLGYAESTKIPLLQPMLSTFSMTTHLPTIEQDFLISSTMYLFSHALELELQNPLNAVITVLAINGTASYKGHPLGRILVDFEHDYHTRPILIPANDHKDESSGYTKTPKLPVVFDFSSVAYEALRRALGGSLEVDIVCHIKTKVGNMGMWVDYTKNGVSTRVRKGF